MSCTAADQHCVAFLCCRSRGESCVLVGVGLRCRCHAPLHAGTQHSCRCCSAHLAAGLAWLCSISRQGRHSMDHLLLLLWPAALSPVARPGPARTSSPPPSDRAGVVQRTIHHPSISLKRRERGHPLLIDRDPAITSRLPQLPLNSQLHRRPHLRRRLAAAKEMPRPSASNHRLP